MANPLENIGTFHKCVGVVFDLLYAAFPVPIDIDALYIEENRPRSERVLFNFHDEMESWDEPGNNSEHNPVKDVLLIYRCSLLYLREEDYMQSDQIEHGSAQRLFRNCRLTSKGLSALGRVGVEEKTTLGRALHDVVRNGRYAALQGLVIRVLSGGVG